MYVTIKHLYIDDQVDKSNTDFDTVITGDGVGTDGVWGTEWCSVIDKSVVVVIFSLRASK